MRFYGMDVDGGLRMIELKREINGLCEQLGSAIPYPQCKKLKKAEPCPENS